MNIAKKSLLVALLAGLGLSAGLSTATAQERVYVIDQRDVVAIGCQCDPDLVPQSVCNPSKPTAVPTSEKISVAADALFDFNKATLRPAGKAKLDELVAKANAINLEVILAVGHTDRIGSVAYNQALSEKRAAAVKNYLVSKGIDPSRIYAEGKGKSQPVTGDTCVGNKKTKALIECLQPDRRVDIEVIGTK